MCNLTFESLEVELDSSMVVQMINGNNNAPWRIQSTIDNIRAKIFQRSITVKHCYGEANEVVDALAKDTPSITIRQFSQVKENFLLW